MPSAIKTTSGRRMMSKKPNPKWFVYLLACANGKLYCGITTDLEARFRKHAAGKDAKFTRANRPSHIIAAKPCRSRSEASKLEWAIKRLTPDQKRALALRWPDFNRLA